MVTRSWFSTKKEDREGVVGSQAASVEGVGRRGKGDLRRKTT